MNLTVEQGELWLCPCKLLKKAIKTCDVYCAYFETLQIVGFSVDEANEFSPSPPRRHPHKNRALVRGRCQSPLFEKICRIVIVWLGKCGVHPYIQTVGWIRLWYARWVLGRNPPLANTARWIMRDLLEVPLWCKWR